MRGTRDRRARRQRKDRATAARQTKAAMDTACPSIASDRGDEEPRKNVASPMEGSSSTKYSASKRSRDSRQQSMYRSAECSQARSVRGGEMLGSVKGNGNCDGTGIAARSRNAGPNSSAQGSRGEERERWHLGSRTPPQYGSRRKRGRATDSGRCAVSRREGRRRSPSRSRRGAVYSGLSPSLTRRRNATNTCVGWGVGRKGEWRRLGGWSGGGREGAQRENARAWR